MRHLINALLGIVLTTGAASAGPLDELAWSKRVLVVFSASDDAWLAEQKAALESVPAEALGTRDIVVLHVPVDGSTHVLFGDANSSYSADALRRSLNVGADAGFTAILVGKDGGTKWRESRPARPDELFDLIDSMPMRAQEMKRNRPAG